ncbi:hypothetical protein QRD02_14220 [Aequorivita sp. SDUM287046]|uniref:TerB family tellurite resistance protein n=1 Tax=Aequorivita aurantiaca TaxID=3053356 RepID=A0ABT8DJI1_9FLAO|nr:hypothetical protein [Aequorivita aurantiaca]MDN3725537.1 hypothetical protein [Aequorivita aurantiaca]
MSNTNQNLLNQVLAELAITEIMEALTTVESALPTATLTDEQRRELNSINVDNKVFAEEVLDEMNTNPIAAVNGTYNKEFLANDLSLFEQTESILSWMKNISQRVEDIRRLAGHEGYGLATAAYGMYDVLARSGVPGAQASYDRLKPRFAKNGGKPVDDNETIS